LKEDILQNQKRKEEAKNKLFEESLIALKLMD